MWKNTPLPDKCEVTIIVIKGTPYNRRWYVVIRDSNYNDRNNILEFIQTIKSRNPRKPWLSCIGLDDLYPMPHAKKMIDEKGEVELEYNKIFRYIRNVNR